MDIDISTISKTLWDGEVWIAEYIYDFVMFFPRLFYSAIVNGAEHALDAIPDPCCVRDFIQDFNTLQGLSGGGGGGGGSSVNIGAGVAYMLGIFDVEVGVKVLFCAMLSRFIFRHLPLIGR
ncbi:MAG: hypothetical protein PHH11_11505 [Methylomonas sp.]|nr:hypothetical protein [Methylomonas sp.]